MSRARPERACPAVRTYAMAERSRHLDFDIRDQSGRAPLTQPHKHEYFQIQVSLEGATQHHVGGTVRPFTPGTLSFVLPHRMHLVPHPPGTRWLVVNFSQRFLWPDLRVDPLDLEDVPLALAPELAPFQFQEHLDFTFGGADWQAVLAVLDMLQQENTSRRLASAARIRGGLLELLARACRYREVELRALAANQAQRGSRRAAWPRCCATCAANWRASPRSRARPRRPASRPTTSPTSSRRKRAGPSPNC